MLIVPFVAFVIDAVKSDEDGPQEFDNSCFNGKYVTGDISLEYLDSLIFLLF